jgi:hypothetical protein
MFENGYHILTTELTNQIWWKLQGSVFILVKLANRFTTRCHLRADQSTVMFLSAKEVSIAVSS